MMVDFDAESHIFRSPGYRSAVAQALEFFAKTPVHHLPPPNDPRFVGPGVYALYYVGDNDLYAEIAQANRSGCVQPIYVGKAVPPGWRTARTSASETKDLQTRLRQHAESLNAGEGLRREDFLCRFMILNEEESDLVVPVEASLIRRYRPVWNTDVSGFGNHHVGKTRYDQKPSDWDTLHPGRPWALKQQGSPTPRDTIVAKVRQALSKLPLA